MKVKLTKRSMSSVPGQKTEGWITVGQEYDVLTMYIEPADEFLVRVIADDGFTPALFPADLFEITDGTVPPNWIVVRDRNGIFRFSPQAWLEPGFWERFFDRDPLSIEIFEKERITATRE
jgi:hypothetical protein